MMTAREMVTINVAGMLMPKEEHSELLKILIPALDGRKSPIDSARRQDQTGDDGKPLRSAVLMSFSTSPKRWGVSLSTMICIPAPDTFSRKHPSLRIPVEGLAEAYLHMVSPCPTRIYPKLELGPYLVNMIKKADAKGLIIIMVKFCEAHDYTYPHMRRHLDAAGIPYLMIKTEHETTPTEQIKTRLQAFLEIVRGT